MDCIKDIHKLFMSDRSALDAAKAQKAEKLRRKESRRSHHAAIKPSKPPAPDMTSREADVYKEQIAIIDKLIFDGNVQLWGDKQMYNERKIYLLRELKNFDMQGMESYKTRDEKDVSLERYYTCMNSTQQSIISKISRLGNDPHQDSHVNDLVRMCLTWILGSLWHGFKAVDPYVTNVQEFKIKFYLQNGWNPFDFFVPNDLKREWILRRRRIYKNFQQ
jgi:hypothetical protein